MKTTFLSSPATLFATLLLGVLTPSAFAQHTMNQTGSTLSEELVSYEYHSLSNTQLQIVTHEQSYTASDSLMNAPVSSSRTQDNLTGQTLRSRDGDQMNSETDNRYDSLGRPLSTTLVDSGRNRETKSFHYTMTATGRSVSVTAANGVMTSTNFNALGQQYQQYQQTDPSSPKTLLATMTYNDLGQQQSQTTLNGITTTAVYDANGRKTQSQQKDSEGDTRTQTTSYDDVALTATTNTFGVSGSGEKEFGVTHTQQLNDAQKPITETDTGLGSDSLTSQTTYDNFALAIKQRISPNSDAATTSTSTYDALGRMATTKIAAMKASDTAIDVRFKRGLNDKLLSKSLWAEKSQATPLKRYQYTYDGLGNLQTETRYHGDKTIQETYTYAHNGYQSTMTDWAGQQFMTNYQDVLGKKVKVSETIPEKAGTDGHTNVLTYYPNTGLLHTSGRKNTPAETTYAYYPTGAIKSITYADGKHITYHYYGYDAGEILPPKAIDIDRVASKTDAAGLTTRYTYQGFGETATITEEDNNHQQVGQISKTDYPLGEVKQIDRESTKNTKIDQAQYVYTGLKQVRTITRLDHIATQGRTVESRLSYQYDKKGNVKQKTISYGDSAMDTVTYDYNNLNQLKRVHETDTSGPASEHCDQGKQYYYDVNGNVTAIQPILYQQTGRSGLGISTTAAKTYHYNNIDELTTANGKSLEYDDDNKAGDGNMTTDANGNIYTYTADNHLASYQAKSSNTVTNYTYYANGLRKDKSQTVDAKDKNPNTVNLHFYYDGDTLANTQETDTQASKNNGVFSAYLMDGTQAAARFLVNKAGQVIQSEFFNHDVRGSVISGIKLNATGQATSDIYKYHADGTVRAAPTSDRNHLTIDYNPMQYGLYTDQENGNEYHKARYVANLGGVMRFVSRDFGYQLMNLYQLDQGNRVGYSDVEGHMLKGVGKFFKDIISNASVGGGELGAEGLGAELLGPEFAVVEGAMAGLEMVAPEVAAEAEVEEAAVAEGGEAAAEAEVEVAAEAEVEEAAEAEVEEAAEAEVEEAAAEPITSGVGIPQPKNMPDEVQGFITRAQELCKENDLNKNKTFAKLSGKKEENALIIIKHINANPSQEVKYFAFGDWDDTNIKKLNELLDDAQLYTDATGIDATTYDGRPELIGCNLSYCDYNAASWSNSRATLLRRLMDLAPVQKGGFIEDYVV